VSWTRPLKHRARTVYGLIMMTRAQALSGKSLACVGGKVVWGARLAYAATPRRVYCGALVTALDA